MLKKDLEKFYKNLDKYREEKETKPRILEIYQNKVNFKYSVGTVENLIEIHKYIFFDIYDGFEGLVRDINISKGMTKFCLAEFIQDNINIINNKKDTNLDEIIEKYSDINMLHPFYEGNGRSGRVWLDLLLKERLNIVVDWKKVNKNDYMECMIKSIYNTDDLKTLISENITENIDDINVYLNSIDASYKIENMNNYYTKNLIK